MSKFFSIGGMAPSGGEGQMGGGTRTPGDRPLPSKEQLEQRHPAFFKNRSEEMTAPWGRPGDKFKIHGDAAEVLHVEKENGGTSQDVYLRRSSAHDSGTYKMSVESGPDRTQQIRKLKRTFE